MRYTPYGTHGREIKQEWGFELGVDFIKLIVAKTVKRGSLFEEEEED